VIIAGGKILSIPENVACIVSALDANTANVNHVGQAAKLTEAKTKLRMLQEWGVMEPNNLGMGFILTMT
jgi:hypothetical protein